MTDTTTTAGDWLDMQRKYWETWTDLGRKALGGESTPTSPWVGTLDHWWQAMSPALPDDLARDFMGRLIEQGKAFHSITEYFTKGLGVADGSTPQGLDALTKTFQEMQKAFTDGQINGDRAYRSLMAFWELPLDNWQRMMSSLSPVPGDLLRNMPHDQVKDSVNRVLSAPGLGYTREGQARHQDLVRRAMDYQNALQDYTGFFAQLGVKALEQMRHFLQSQAEQGTTIETARHLYDSWIGCCEQVYAEEVSSPEYARIHGHLVNAQMALKQSQTTMVDESLGVMNMPTRKEMRTLQDRLQQARRADKQMHQELEALKRQVQALSERPPSQPPAPSVAPKTAPPKTAAPKRTATSQRKTAPKPTGK